MTSDVRILGFIGTCKIGRDALGRPGAVLQPRDVIQLPRKNAEELLRANRGVCDLTALPTVRAWGTFVPTPTVRRFQSWNDAYALERARRRST